MKSRLFLTDDYKTVQENVKSFLNGHPNFLSPDTARSTRAAGDAIAEILGDNLESILGEHCSEYSAGFARRAMADLAFKDSDGLYYVVDVKTHRQDTKFNMPNLTSVERISRFYEDDNNYFVVLVVKYGLEGMRCRASEVVLVPIEFLDWDCLTVGALGWGQIQITDSNRITLRPQFSRKKWMLELCEVMLQFYPREIEKIHSRLGHFEKVREFWLGRPDE
ncbi:MAG: hypothetical protein JXQ73_14975 [Phycisphaerae bacterium]|nr:hypothetical protein [Phycisphaerae bacterium]